MDTLYETNFYPWMQQQAAYLRQGNLNCSILRTGVRRLTPWAKKETGIVPLP